jgi:hypothetical protein
MRDGAEGIESDVHVSLDDTVLMFHDPSLERTTDGKGLIRERKWLGTNGMEHIRTVKEPKQAIPTFEQTIALLMQPENQHVKFNVDVKVQNDPARLFPLMHAIISSHNDWETLLAPRLLLGLWHPRFLSPAEKHLPYCRRSYIGYSPAFAKKYFWNSCDVFSMSFPSMTTIAGEKFRKDCKSAGKKLMVWTVNDAVHMMEAVRWDVDVILTDKTQNWLELRSSLHTDYKKMSAQYPRMFLWTTLTFYSPYQLLLGLASKFALEKVAGPFDHEFPEKVSVETPTAVAIESKA